MPRVHGVCDPAIVRNTTEDVTGTLGERVAERRGQAHQPLEPDLGKPDGVVGARAEDDRRECDRRTRTAVV